MSGKQKNVRLEARNSVPFRVRRKVVRASQIKAADWLSLGVASLALLRARIVLARVPIRELIEALQNGQSDPTDMKLSTVDKERLRQLCWALATAAGNLPWRTDCLVQVIAADRILRRLGWQPEFYLGVRKDDSGSFFAHAWLKYRGVEVVGGSSHEFAALLDPDRDTRAGSFGNHFNK